MIEVYYMNNRFSGSGSEKVAEFIDEKLFKACEEALEKDAKKHKMTMHFRDKKDTWHTYYYECKECSREWERYELKQYRSKCRECETMILPHVPAEVEELV